METPVQLQKSCNLLGLASGLQALNCGLDPLYLQAQVWWDCGPQSQVRNWSGDIPDPFKRRISPLRVMPAGDEPRRVKPDVMHSWNLGWGKDMAGSGIILLCRHNVFGPGSIQVKLEAAYLSFRAWCETTRKTTSLKQFDLKTFKMTSSPPCRSIILKSLLILCSHSPWEPKQQLHVASFGSETSPQGAGRHMMWLYFANGCKQH